MIPADVARLLRWCAISGERHYRATDPHWTPPDGWTATLELLTVAMRAGQPDADPEWLTLDQARHRAHVSERTLYSMRRDGLPSSKAKGRVLIRRADLDAYLLAHRQASAEVPAHLGNRAA
jgi:hypothetical protein